MQRSKCGLHFLLMAGLFLGFGSGFSLLVSQPAQAQALRYMSCGELWYARNEIYAAHGYCFRTARARAVFGRQCLTRNVRLSRYERNRVADIRYWERRKGCR